MAEDSQKLTPRRPYLLRAIYEWLVDNQLTPHVVVDASQDGCDVPLEYVKDGQIILNIAPPAVAALQMTNEFVQFSGRFGGKPRQVWIPIACVVAIYARENGAGTIFEQEDNFPDNPGPSSSSGPTAVDAGAAADFSESKDKPSTNEHNDTKKSPRKRNHLKVIK